MRKLIPLKMGEWVQHKPAEDEDHNSVNPWSPRAKKWCLAGWMEREAMTTIHPVWQIESAIKCMIGAQSIPEWNDKDHRTESDAVWVTAYVANALEASA